MLSIAHAATGAFIAVKVGNPFVALPLILLSHYLEDLVAHWDAGTGLGKGVKTTKQAFWHEIIDLGLTVVVVLTFFPLSPTPLTSIPQILTQSQVWGALTALLPDLLESPRNFFKYEPGWLKPVNRFHAHFHHSIPDPLSGLAPQLLLLAVIYLLR